MAKLPDGKKAIDVANLIFLLPKEAIGIVITKRTQRQVC